MRPRDEDVLFFRGLGSPPEEFSKELKQSAKVSGWVRERDEPDWDADEWEAPRAGPARRSTSPPPARPSPPSRSPSRNRRHPLILRAFVASLVVLALLGFADRWAVSWAEDKAGEKLQSALHLEARPDVKIRGFPFLSQLLVERELTQVDATIPDVPAGRFSIARVEGSVRDIRIVGDLSTSIRGAVAERMNGRAIVTFDDLHRELGTSQVKYKRQGGTSIVAQGKLPVAGREVRIGARARVSQSGTREIVAVIDKMRLDVSGVGTYIPGKHGGFVLAPELAKRIAKEEKAARAFLSVPYVARKLGFSPKEVRVMMVAGGAAAALGKSPQFKELVRRDPGIGRAVLEHPVTRKVLGVSGQVVDQVKSLKMPVLSDRLSFRVRLPDLPGDTKLRGVRVVGDGVQAQISGTDLPFGKT